MELLVAGAVPLAAWLGRHGHPPLPSRRTPSGERLLALLSREPGLPLGEAARRLGVTWSTLSYHVRRLAQSERVVVRRVGRRSLLYPQPPPDHEPPEARALLFEPAALRVAEAVARGRGSDVREIVHRTGESPRVVYHHLKRLIDAGLVLSAAPPRRVKLAPAPRLLALLRER